MAEQRGTAVSKYLAWAFLQSLLFVPLVLGPMTFEEFPNQGWGFRAFALALIGWVGFALARNLGRLWRAPAREAREWHVVLLLVDGLLLALLSSGPLIESMGASAKPAGAVTAVVAANFIALGFREVFRLRRRRAGAGDGRQSTSLSSWARSSR